MSDARFLSPTRVQYLAEWDGWRPKRVLLAELRYYSAILGAEIKVPAGFVFDGESMPTAGPVTGPHCIPAGAVHDWLYASHLVDKDVADRIYQEALIAYGIDPFYADMRWRAVRDYGSGAYESAPARLRVLSVAALAAATL